MLNLLGSVNKIQEEILVVIHQKEVLVQHLFKVRPQNTKTQVIQMVITKRTKAKQVLLVIAPEQILRSKGQTLRRVIITLHMVTEKAKSNTYTRMKLTFQDSLDIDLKALVQKWMSLVLT